MFSFFPLNSFYMKHHKYICFTLRTWIYEKKMWRDNCANISDDQRRRSCRYICARTQIICEEINIGVWRRRRSGFAQCNHSRSTIDGEREKKWHTTFLAGRQSDQGTSPRITSTGSQPGIWNRTSDTADAFLVDGTRKSRKSKQRSLNGVRPVDRSLRAKTTINHHHGEVCPRLITSPHLIRPHTGTHSRFRYFRSQRHSVYYFPYSCNRTEVSTYMSQCNDYVPQLPRASWKNTRIFF